MALLSRLSVNDTKDITIGKMIANNIVLMLNKLHYCGNHDITKKEEMFYCKHKFINCSGKEETITRQRKNEKS